MYVSVLLPLVWALAPCATVALVITPPSCTNGQLVGRTTCRAECDTDRPGADYKAVKVASFESCATACFEDSKCVTAQYHKDTQYCYLKDALNPSTKDTNDDGVVCRAPFVSGTTTVSKTTTTTTKASIPPTTSSSKMTTTSSTKASIPPTTTTKATTTTTKATTTTTKTTTTTTKASMSPTTTTKASIPPTTTTSKTTTSTTKASIPPTTTTTKTSTTTTKASMPPTTTTKASIPPTTTTTKASLPPTTTTARTTTTTGKSFGSWSTVMTTKTTSMTSNTVGPSMQPSVQPSMTPTPTPSPPSDPGCYNLKGTYKASTGVVFRVECDKGPRNFGLQIINQTPNFEACMDVCASETGCVAAAYVAFQADNMLCVRSSVYNFTRDGYDAFPGVDLGYLVF